MLNKTLYLSLTALPFMIAMPAFADDVALTIYGDNRALVVDNRTLNLKNGEQVIEMPGVSSQIISPSVTLKADGIEIIEQNFDFDLLSPSKLMEKAVGQYVEIIRTNPATGVESSQRVKVLSVNNGVVIQTGDSIEVLRDDNIPTRVVFPKVPDNLRAKPTLSVAVDSSVAGRRDAQLTYLTNGINWRGDYVAVFDEKAEAMSLQGWATINNQTNTNFEDAELSVVAGQIGNQNNRNNYNRNRNRNNGLRNGGFEAGSAERIGDNYIYPLPGRTTLATKQTKQISFVDADAIKAKKVYEFYPNGFQTIENPQSVDSRIAFSNSKAGGLGEALPKGTVRVYSKDKRNKSQFVGESEIGHMAAGSDISMKIGEAFDITVKSTKVKETKVSRYVLDTEMKYEVRNAKPEAATVYIHHNFPGWFTKWTILEENINSEDREAYSKIWAVKVPANGSADLTFKIRRDWR